MIVECSNLRRRWLWTIWSWVADGRWLFEVEDAERIVASESLTWRVRKRARQLTLNDATWHQGYDGRDRSNTTDMGRSYRTVIDSTWRLLKQIEIRVNEEEFLVMFKSSDQVGARGWWSRPKEDGKTRSQRCHMISWPEMSHFVSAN